MSFLESSSSELETYLKSILIRLKRNESFVLAFENQKSNPYVQSFVWRKQEQGIEVFDNELDFHAFKNTLGLFSSNECDVLHTLADFTILTSSSFINILMSCQEELRKTFEKYNEKYDENNYIEMTNSFFSLLSFHDLDSNYYRFFGFKMFQLLSQYSNLPITLFQSIVLESDEK